MARFKVTTHDHEDGPYVVETDDLAAALQDFADSVRAGAKVTFKAKAVKQ